MLTYILPRTDERPQTSVSHTRARFVTRSVTVPQQMHTAALFIPTSSLLTRARRWKQ